MGLTLGEIPISERQRVRGGVEALRRGGRRVRVAREVGLERRRALHPLRLLQLGGGGGAVRHGFHRGQMKRCSWADCGMRYKLP